MLTTFCFLLFHFLQQGKDSSYVTMSLPVEVTQVQLPLIWVTVYDYRMERTKGIFLKSSCHEKSPKINFLSFILGKTCSCSLCSAQDGTQSPPSGTVLVSPAALTRQGQSAVQSSDTSRGLLHWQERTPDCKGSPWAQSLSPFTAGVWVGPAGPSEAKWTPAVKQ